MAVDGTPVTDTVVDRVMSVAKVTLAAVHVLHIKPSDFPVSVLLVHADTAAA